VNAQGHVTSGSNPTTLSGYGITDAETKSDASKKLNEAKAYADSAASQVKNDLLNGAGAAYDTLKELGDLIDDNVDAIEALETVAAGKADKVHSHDMDDLGIYVQNTEPTNAVAGDIWVDTANDPAFIVPNLPEVTSADNGKVLMVVNGRWQAVTLNLTADANGVVSI
jgi:phage-related tail fiber protein